MENRSKLRKRPTQADVAQLASVSQGAVSQVLNNRSALAISEETRQRILLAIQELGYVPDRTARSLRTRKMLTIASIIPDIANPFYPAFQRGIQDVADAHGYDLIIYNTDGVAAKEEKCLQSALQGGVDGLIVVLFHQGARVLIPLLERNIAIVRLESQYRQPGAQPLDNVYVDNVAAAQTAVTYLIERGHVRIGMLARHVGPGNQRMLGYQRALLAHNIAQDASLIQHTDFTEEGGFAGVTRLLALPVRPTAIFATNDMMALGALRAVQEAGLQVPQDVAIVGFDDIPAARLVNPPLTTVAQFQVQLGRRSAELLFERLQGGISAEGRSVEMPYRLVVRKSA